MRISSNATGCAKSNRTHAGTAGKPAAGLAGAGFSTECHMVFAPLIVVMAVAGQAGAVDQLLARPASG